MGCVRDFVCKFFRGISVNQNAPKNGNQGKRGPLCVRDVPASSSAGLGHTHTYTRDTVSECQTSITPWRVSRTHTLEPATTVIHDDTAVEAVAAKEFFVEIHNTNNSAFSFRFSGEIYETGSHVWVRVYVGGGGK